MRVSKQYAVNLRTLGFEYLGDSTTFCGARTWTTLGYGRVVRGLSPGFLLKECRKVSEGGRQQMNPGHELRSALKEEGHLTS